MRGDEFERFLGPSLEEYSQYVARNHGISVDAARARSEASTSEMLPDGLHTRGHRFFVAEDDDGDHVGELWLGSRQLGGTDVVWVYDVRVDEERRGRGLGRLIMESAEDLAREMGGDRLGLNVFGDNRRARRLYESLGYTEISRQMRMDLATSPVDRTAEAGASW